MRNTLLSLVVACGLLLVGPAAYARVDGECQSIGVSVGPANQILHGINMMDNCTALAVNQMEFLAAGCSFLEDSAGGPILANGASCNLIATLCDAVSLCFDVELGFCKEVVPACTIP